MTSQPTEAYSQSLVCWDLQIQVIILQMKQKGEHSRLALQLVGTVIVAHHAHGEGNHRCNLRVCQQLAKDPNHTLWFQQTQKKYQNHQGDNSSA